jgi:hypothetical protein
MTGTVLELCDVISPDRLATQISDQWITLDSLRNGWKSGREEIRKYVYATDTSFTSNSDLPWKNKTTIPKLCQIRDNLLSNYTATLFPQKKWLIWEANETEEESTAKRDAISNYMSWVISQPGFKSEMDKIVLDYIDYGNCFVTVEWSDERVEQPDKTQIGYVGPSVRRISPMNLVMNPTAEHFHRSPKIIRTLVSLGEIKEHLQRLATDETTVEYQELWKYLKRIREDAASFNGDWKEFDNLYIMDGFTSYREYLKSGMVEVLTFYGDIYDKETEDFYKNHVITVVDRHKLIGKRPNPSFFGYPPIFHAAWRKRPDNLWGMGPLDNLVGMQYRLDHIENMKADIMDLTTFPVQKIKGMVEDFTWQPGEKIYVSEEGDVELVVPNVQALQANFELDRLETKMEEMSGSPREAMGFRTPGEKTKYEVQRLENAASRIFQNKIKQFEEQIVEPLLNAMLELARRNMTGVQTIKVFDDEFKAASFQALTVQDITGIGRIKPAAARHFAEQAELVQNLTNLTGSGLWQTVQPHFSGIKLAKILENIFNIEQFEVVIPNVAITEQAEGQKLAQTLQEQIHMQGQTATGMGEDFDMPGGPAPIAPQPAK